MAIHFAVQVHRKRAQVPRRVIQGVAINMIDVNTFDALLDFRQHPFLGCCCRFPPFSPEHLVKHRRQVFAAGAVSCGFLLAMPPL